jgi:hypothetical protein
MIPGQEISKAAQGYVQVKAPLVFKICCTPYKLRPATAERPIRSGANKKHALILRGHYKSV